MYGSGDTADRIAVARLAGAVSHHAGWKKELTAGELEAAVAELREITEGRPGRAELMAEVAGVALGARAGIPGEEDKARVEAEILKAAGADISRIAYWTGVGAERAALARQPPLGSRILGHGRQAQRPAGPGAGEASWD